MSENSIATQGLRSLLDSERHGCNIVVITGTAMIKTLRKQGNGHVLPFDKSTMEAMGIEIDTPLQVTVSGNSLVVTPVHTGTYWGGARGA